MTEADFKRIYLCNHVLVTVPDTECRADTDMTQKEWRHFLHDAWGGPLSLVLDVGDRVWLHASYSHEGLPSVHRVGTGEGNGYDSNGNCVLSVPAAWCKFITQEEAENIWQMQDADDELLSYAT
jgi:hypothetical protein